MSSQPPTPPSSPQPQPQPAMAQPIPYHMLRPRRSGVKTFFLILFIFCFIGSVMLNMTLTAQLATIGSDKVVEKFYAYNEVGTHKIVIITLDGAILTGEGFIEKQIRQATKDENVCGVVLRVNSPGGTVYGSDQILHHLRELKKKRDIPIVVSMGGIAASGGYYISMAVGDQPDSIFAEPTTWTGSIGVKIPHYDLSKLLDNLGIENNTIAEGKFKNMGSFTKPMTKDEEDLFKKLVAQSFEQFKDVIKSGRPKFAENPKLLDGVATGAVFSAKDAVKNGLVDKIGYLDDAVNRAIELADVSKEDVRVVKYEKVPTLFSMLAEAKSPDQLNQLKTLLNMNSPRAFYLFSWDD